MKNIGYIAWLLFVGILALVIMDAMTSFRVMTTPTYTLEQLTQMANIMATLRTTQGIVTLCLLGIFTNEMAKD
ncbi:MAG: hypothetical protein ACXADD_18150 [Candidatus Thorarchaeota archaeon]|jgi:hypothetical protein